MCHLEKEFLSGDVICTCGLYQRVSGGKNVFSQAKYFAYNC